MRILGGYSPAIYRRSVMAGTYAAREDVVLSTSGGISVDEMGVLYELSTALDPENVLIIGNSYGISTVFLSLCNPDACVVAFDKYRLSGIEVTNKMLVDVADARAVQGSTPEDIVRIWDKFFAGRHLDLVLIDAVHENAIQSAEVRTLRQFMSTKSCIVMHDVMSCNLVASYFDLKLQLDEFAFWLLHRTTSGIGVAVKGIEKLDSDLSGYLDFLASSRNEVADFVTWSSTREAYNEDYIGARQLTFRTPPHPQN